MTIPDNLGAADKAAYEAGVPPLAWSQGKVAGIIHAHLATGIPAPLNDDPDGFLAALSGRILASLLDAGWTPPGGIP